MSDFHLSLGSCFFSYFVRTANERAKVAPSLRAHLSLLIESREGCEKNSICFVVILEQFKSYALP